MWMPLVGLLGQFGRLVKVLIFGKLEITCSFLFLSGRMMSRGPSLTNHGVLTST